MKAGTALVSQPAIATLIDNDPFFSRIQEIHQSIANRAFQFFQDGGFEHGHDLENWLQAESELIEQTPLKVSETDEQFNVCAEVPGLTEKDIEVKVDLHRLFIAGRREEPSARKESESTDRSIKQILYQCDLPVDIDTSKVTAELRNGMLDVTLPKRVQSTKVVITSKAA